MPVYIISGFSSVTIGCLSEVRCKLTVFNAKIKCCERMCTAWSFLLINGRCASYTSFERLRRPLFPQRCDWIFPLINSYTHLSKSYLLCKYDSQIREKWKGGKLRVADSSVSPHFKGKAYRVLLNSSGFSFEEKLLRRRWWGVACISKRYSKDFSTPRFAKSAISSQSWVLRSRSFCQGFYASESALRIQLRQTFCLPLF